jgi:catalase
VVPGIDFTNDPLLQGRNFSYLDTQLKRLGGPNFTHLPINAPKCPVHMFQQDGHMAMINPRGRANYEPNSWPGAEGGPRETEAGYRSHPTEEGGGKRRIRPESFADHYSQARQFYISQTPVEQAHMADALVFELSKVETPEIRARVVSHLLNIDGGLARSVADGLGLKEMPDPADAARPTRDDLAESPALSILKNGPDSFRGRKLGVLATDGVDAELIAALRAAAEAEGAMMEVIAPAVGGVTASDGRNVPGDEKIDGGPSVLYDAVAILPSAEGVQALMATPQARDFAAFAIAHYKFIAYTEAARPLLQAAGAPEDLDAGFRELRSPDDAPEFIRACRALRCWDRAGA